jgi:periplasmic protein TonB
MKQVFCISALILSVACFGQGQPAANDTAGANVTVYTTVEEQAEYPGGLPAMSKFMQENLTYPVSARQQGTEGKCFLKFIVNTSGNIEQIQVLKGVPNCEECDKEAMRVIKLMPAWKPAKINGRAVPCYFNLPINFKLTNK